MTVNAKLDIKLEQQSTGLEGPNTKNEDQNRSGVYQSFLLCCNFFPARFSEKQNYVSFPTVDRSVNQ